MHMHMLSLSGQYVSARQLVDTHSHTTKEAKSEKNNTKQTAKPTHPQFSQRENVPRNEKPLQIHTKLFP